MATRIRAVRTPEEFRLALGQIGRYFAWEPDEDDAERIGSWMPHDRVHAAFDGQEIVAATGVWPTQLTIPGASLPCGGVTVVATAPTHRRRGLMARLMDVQLRDVRERGEPLAALWASEETIYGRYGYGMTSVTHRLLAECAALEFAAGMPSAGAKARLIGDEEARRLLPPLYERLRRRTTGFLQRSRTWWERRVLADAENDRGGAGPLQRVVFEVGGRPVGYALYRVKSESAGGEWTKTLRVREAFGEGDAVTADVWRYLGSIDWMDSVEVWRLPVDHPLQQLAARINELKLTVFDGLWVRVVDVAAVLSSRSFAQDGAVVVEIATDPHFPDNVGGWLVEPGSRARPTRRRADVRLPVQSLGALLLGGFSFAQLARVGRVSEERRGGLARADALFRTPVAPWCPEMF